MTALPPGNGVEWDTAREDTDMYWLSSQTLDMLRQQAANMELTVTRPFKRAQYAGYYQVPPIISLNSDLSCWKEPRWLLFNGLMMQS